MKQKHTATIFLRVCIPLFVVMILESAMFYFVTVHGHILRTLNENAADILTECVENRKNELQADFSSKWTDLRTYQQEVNAVYNQYVRTGEKPLYADENRQKLFLKDISDTLITMLRNDSVNGAFVILNNSGVCPTITDYKQSYYGLCVWDYDQTAAYTDREDLLTVRCPSSIAADIRCPLDTYWEAWYTFDTDSLDQGDYFYRPMQQAYQTPDADAADLAYLSGVHSFVESSPKMISYSIPLIGADHTVYGVMGVELSVNYLTSLLPDSELEGQGQGAYALVKYAGDDLNCYVVAYSGTMFERIFLDKSRFSLQAEDKLADSEHLYQYHGRQDRNVYCAVSPMKVYNRHTPFEQEKFALVGITPDQVLLSVSDEIRQSLLVITLVMLGIGCMVSILISHLLTHPIKRLALRVKNMKPEDGEGLEHINIKEIDQLVDALETKTQTINQTRVRTEFFSRMSHDMRTPMNAIIGFSSPEVTNACEKEQLLEYLAKINGSGKYLLGLINEVLDMTKIDSGKMELKIEPFSSTQFWDMIIAMIDELAARKEICFTADIRKLEDRYLYGDKQRLNQIFVNLLSNAVKFTPDGGSVSLVVTETVYVGDHLGYQIVIKDTGVGMSEEFQKKMYEPFAQESPDHDGTGLGLAIARQLIDLMGGTINCESRTGKGTTFTIRFLFPLAEEAKERSEDEAKRAEQEDKLQKLAGKRILLCEDHPLNRQIACKLLHNQQMEVETAENGKTGYEMFAASPVSYYDLILMDIRMPELDGLQATRIIRKMDRDDAKTIPILAMTANAFEEDREAAKAAGMNAHLSKPIEPQVLYDALTEYL